MKENILRNVYRLFSTELNIQPNCLVTIILKKNKINKNKNSTEETHSGLGRHGVGGVNDGRFYFLW